MSLDLGEEDLRSVFELCDQQKNGYIFVEDFIDLAKKHFCDDNEQNISNVVEFLDPEKDGKIYFKDFCDGVKRILNTQQTTTAPQTPNLKRNLENGKICIEDNSEQYVSNTAITPGDASESSYTFNEYDLTDEDGQYSPQASPPKLLISDDLDPDCGHLNGFNGEENFEDVGNGDLEAPLSVLRSKHRRYPGSGDSWPFCKKNPKYARHSIGQTDKSSISLSLSDSRRSSVSDEDRYYEDIDGSFKVLNGKVESLESQIMTLTENQQKNDQSQNRIKYENQSLIERIHTLEMELHDVEERSQKRVAEEEVKYRDLLNRTDKEKEREIQLLSASLQHMESEYSQLKEENPRLRLENEKLRKEGRLYQAKLEQAELNLSAAIKERDEYKGRLREINNELKLERNVNTQLVDELSKELEDLRGCTDVRQRRPSSPDSMNYPPNYRRQLESLVIRLKEENARLKDQNDDLQAQLLGHTIIEGHTLLTSGTSLADEIDCMPKEELTKALRETQEAHRKLQEYVEDITLRIINKNPALLEKH
ncbi:DgyrCDS10567 [Dimorphilus gyrociliatus]|uniref:DgyrCDS10567 n=1 Tax=Dimorphilus gyrociliatus TaxID=2664684 RepID=A0A7I8W1S8_9ANNE|nr:DgyrCDS10567 [Dimorphilus gyrociliatus]